MMMISTFQASKSWNHFTTTTEQTNVIETCTDFISVLRCRVVITYLHDTHLSTHIHRYVGIFSSPSGWRDIGVLFVENRHLEMLLL